MKKLSFLVLLSVFLASTTPTPTLAQENTSASNIRGEINKDQGIIKDKAKLNRDEKNDQVMDKVASRTAQLNERRQQKKAELDKKLKVFRDKKKAEVVKRIDENLIKINSTKTTQMAEQLKKMLAILDKLQQRLDSLSSQGKDLTAANQFVLTARESIAKAQEAVDVQQAKDYTITVTGEKEVKSDAQTVRGNLQTDLTSVHRLVVAARQSVSVAIKTASSLGGQK